MEEKLKSRAMHGFVFLLICIFSLVVWIVWPDLVTRPADTMAFVGFWVTVFGLCVAIIEVVRLGYTSRGLIKAADDAFNDLKLQMELQDVRSCLEIINISIADLKCNKQIPTVFISRIKQLYIAVFSREINAEGSSQCHNILIINSYVHVSAGRRSGTADLYAKNRDVPASPSLDNPSNDGKEVRYRVTLGALNRMHDDLSLYAASKQLYRRAAQ